MLTIEPPDIVEAAIIEAARLTVICADNLSLEIDRARVDSYLAGTPAVSHDRARAWLADLAAGKRTECPRQAGIPML